MNVVAKSIIALVLILILPSAILLALNISPSIQLEPSPSLPSAKDTVTNLSWIVALDASSAPTQTWTQNTRADWEAGTIEYLDSATTPGSLQLARLYFRAPTSLIPSEYLSNWRGNPDIAVDSIGNVYVVWADNRDGDSDIYFAYRPADGTWGNNVKINDETGTAGQYHPAIAIDKNGNAYAVWRDNRNGDAAIYSAYWPAGGPWEGNIRVDDDPYDVTRPRDPDVAVDENGNAYAIWTDVSRYIYFAYKPVGGTWGTNVRVDDTQVTAQIVSSSPHQSTIEPSPTPIPVPSSTPSPQPTPKPGQKYDPAIAVDDNGNAMAVWVDSLDGHFDTYAAYRPAGGAWNTNVRVNEDPGSLLSWSPPAIAMDGNGNAYAIWNQPVGHHIYMAYRPVGGTWGTNTMINDDIGAYRQAPAIAVDKNGNAYAVWQDSRDGRDVIYFAYRPAGGVWGGDIRVADDASTASHLDPEVDVRHLPQITPSPTPMYRQYTPAIAVDDNGHAYIVWEGYNGISRHIYVNRSTQAYRSVGTYTSPVLDTRMITATWESLSHISTIPAGTSLTFSTRSLVSDNDPLSPSNWSDWQSTTPASKALQIESPRGRYLQYRITFSTTLTRTTPVLDQTKITYRWAGAPSAPHLSTPCGVTNQTAPLLRGSAIEGSVVRLYVDGTEVATQTVGPGTLSLGAFAFTHNLTAGSHTITATAENENGTGPASPPLNLIVSPTIAYDPINVRAGEWMGDKWLLSVPRDSNGCANPANDWRVWPRSDQPFQVRVPVSYTTSAVVTVTVGTLTITLTEEGNTGLFFGTFSPPIETGEFVIQVNADGRIDNVTGGPVLIDPDGVVYEATGSISDTISGVTVTCYYSDTYRGQWITWDAWNYQQINPQLTSDNGYYSFYTPRGTYRVVAEKSGYPTYTSPDLQVINVPVRHNIPLGWHRIYLPLIMRDALS